MDPRKSKPLSKETVHEGEKAFTVTPTLVVSWPDTSWIPSWSDIWKKKKKKERINLDKKKKDVKEGECSMFTYIYISGQISMSMGTILHMHISLNVSFKMLL